MSPFLVLLIIFVEVHHLQAWKDQSQKLVFSLGYEVLYRLALVEESKLLMSQASPDLEGIGTNLVSFGLCTVL